MKHRLSKAVVTGADGFMGRALCRLLAQRDCEVIRIGSSRSSDGSTHAADLSQPGHWSRLITADAVVFHLAGRASVPDSVVDPLASKQHNLDAAVHVLEAARQSGAAVLLASTGSVYADAVEPCPEDAPTAPRSPYAAAKLAAEQFAGAYASSFKMRIWTARLFSVYGPRMRGMAMRDFVLRLREDSHCLTIRGDGRQLRDYIHVDDAVRALLHLVEQAPCATYNVASGNSTAVADLAAAVAAACGYPNCRICPDGENPAGEPFAMRADIARLRDTGFTTQVTLQAGLAETVDWLQHSIKEHNHK